MNYGTKPYILRALYEWCGDNGHTPYIAVWVNEHTRVPTQFVKDHEIVLNIGANACKNLHIDNEWISFHARFGGVSHEIWIPIGHVISLFAKESGEGMGFEIIPWQPDTAKNAPQPAAGQPSTAENTPRKGPRLVK